MSEQTQNQETAQQLAEEENHIIAERRAKLAALREAGVAYPNDFVRTDLFGDIRAKYQDATAEELEELKPEVACSGRMMLKRIMGKASFATVRDFTGDMQYFITKGDIGEEAYAAWKTFDLGDIVAVKGTLFRTKTGELSIRAHELRLMTKNIRPLPDKHKGLVDTEMCYRQRYVDLIMNEDSRNRFLVRSKAIAAIRSFMLAHRFLEVETPMLHPIPGGANAKPFITHHNALDMDMYLRIAPELYLKRLVVGGFERVFEINRNFRNEGVSVRHNPEFTMMEFYCTYWTYRDQMQFTEDLLRTAAREATGSAILPYQGMRSTSRSPSTASPRLKPSSSTRPTTRPNSSPTKPSCAPNSSVSASRSPTTSASAPCRWPSSRRRPKPSSSSRPSSSTIRRRSPRSPAPPTPTTT